jgi:hypothetical protein
MDLREIPVTTGAVITALRMVRAVLAGEPVPMPTRAETLSVLHALANQAAGAMSCALPDTSQAEAEALAIRYIDNQLADLLLGEEPRMPGDPPWTPEAPGAA